MTNEPVRLIGLPWYRPEHYQRIREMMSDRHNLASTYESWLAAAENNEAVGRATGLQVRRILIEPEAFAGWCAERNVEPDSAARRDYVAEKNSQNAP
ncbi:hypothetical protein [Microvirga terrestris]|uniref:DUF1153 domain-containing protein n=1 Tax=Microvirga terrestris TaxID=2791024 RepID=A0ABS0HR25_9HYPH|nr:hypothetical protein [Microvirga terrestris]MBF9195923.1 hypothetical protein [Microvirga terrestris]